MSHLTSFEEALYKIAAKVPLPIAESVPLDSALGHVLAEAVYADLDVPPFRKALMDGYAVRSAEAGSPGVRLTISGEIQAGSVSAEPLAAGQAVRIMTGAPLPAGSDAVQMVEECRLVDPHTVELVEGVFPGQNVAEAASEVRQGARVLRKGEVVGPAQIGVLAAFGYERVQVFRKPDVTVATTGSELVPVDCRPQPGQIRNSNEAMLVALCRCMGLEVASRRVLKDDPAATAELLSELTSQVVVLSGGVSAGDWDFVHSEVKRSSFEIVFHKAAVKPGKPILVAVSGKRLLFGLPGNPVSCFVTYEMFVRPALRRLMGFQGLLNVRVTARLGEPVRQRAGRKFFKPGRCSWVDGRFEIVPIETRGSSDLAAFAPANALLVMEADCEYLPAGLPVEVFLLEKFFLEGGNSEIHAPE